MPIDEIDNDFENDDYDIGFSEDEIIQRLLMYNDNIAKVYVDDDGLITVETKDED